MTALDHSLVTLVAAMEPPHAVTMNTSHTSVHEIWLLVKTWHTICTYSNHDNKVS